MIYLVIPMKNKHDEENEIIDIDPASEYENPGDDHNG